MRTKTHANVSTALIVLLAASPAWAGWDGTLKLGGIVLDEEGDKSTVQETYDIHDGFSLSQLRLRGTPNAESFLDLNLREMNLDSRKGDVLFRMPGLLRFDASYDQNRQVFDPDRGVTSDRRDFDMGARVTPLPWLTVHGAFNTMDREGDRLGYPGSSGAVRGLETESALGTGYDYSMRSGRIGAEARRDGRGIAVDYRGTDFTEDLNPDADRTGNVVSARAWSPCFLYDRLTHFVRASYGVSELASALDYRMYGLQYTGVAQPIHDLRLKYGFDAQRVDHEVDDLRTDRYRQDMDVTYYHRDGNVTAGYSYEMNDDDRRLTSYHSWRTGAVLRGERHTVRVRYSGREKKDVEQLTLLKEVESSRILADVELRPRKDLSMGMGLKVRDREFPDIGVESHGKQLRGNARYSYPGWGDFSGTYTFSKDAYTDLVGGYDVKSHIVTTRVDVDRIPNTRLGTGLTLIDIGKNQDIQKSIFFVEAEYTVAADYHFEVKYNIYNYDDYVLVDRYYTANAVWFNFAYDFHVE